MKNITNNFAEIVKVIIRLGELPKEFTDCSYCAELIYLMSSCKKFTFSVLFGEIAQLCCSLKT